VLPLYKIKKKTFFVSERLDEIHYHKGYLKSLFYTISFLYNLAETYIDSNVKRHKQ